MDFMVDFGIYIHIPLPKSESHVHSSLRQGVLGWLTSAGVKHNMWRIILQQNKVFCLVCLSSGQRYTTHCLVWSEYSLVYVSVTNKLFCRTKPAPGLKVNPPVWSLSETCECFQTCSYLYLCHKHCLTLFSPDIWQFVTPKWLILEMSMFSNELWIFF